MSKIWWDIETTGFDPMINRVTCISFIKDDNIVQTKTLEDEKQILSWFWENIFEGQLLIGFNSNNFDVPFIIKRSMYHKIKPTNNSFMDLKRFSRFPHFDVRAVVNDFDRYGSGNLDLLTQFTGIASPKQGEIKAENVEEAFKNNKVMEILEYCVKDVEATYRLWDIVKDYTYSPGH